MVVEAYSFPGKPEDQFRCRKIFNSKMRYCHPVANITETLFVAIAFFVTQLSGQTGDGGLFTEGLDNLREFAFEAENDLGRLKQFGDHSEAYSCMGCCNVRATE